MSSDDKNKPLTRAQAAAAVTALDSYLLAGTYEECLVAFGSAQGVKAAENARDKLVHIAYKPRAERRAKAKTKT